MNSLKRQIEEHSSIIIMVLIIVVAFQAISIATLKNQISDIEYTADNTAERFSDLEHEIEKNEIFDKIEDFEYRIEELESNLQNDVYLPPLPINW